MNPTPTPESVEAEAARVRLELKTLGADIRGRVDPVAVLDTAKTSFQQRSKRLPGFLKDNAAPVGMLLFGGTLGAVLTRLSSKPSPVKPRGATTTSPAAAAVVETSTRTKVKAALISALGVSLGYGAGLFVPVTQVEQQALGEPKAILAERLEQFRQHHMRGMESAALNLFGASRLSATALMGLAMLAEALGTGAKARV